MMAPVCTSTRTRIGREVAVTRAICRAAQHPERCRVIMCCPARVDRPGTRHTKVVAAAGGRAGLPPCDLAGRSPQSLDSPYVQLRLSISTLSYLPGPVNRRRPLTRVIALRGRPGG